MFYTSIMIETNAIGQAGQNIFKYFLLKSSIDIPANWSSGIYMIRISDNKESWPGAVMIK
jgi:hypothetical protein